MQFVFCSSPLLYSKSPRSLPGNYFSPRTISSAHYIILWTSSLQSSCLLAAGTSEQVNMRFFLKGKLIVLKFEFPATQKCSLWTLWSSLSSHAHTVFSDCLEERLSYISGNITLSWPRDGTAEMTLGRFLYKSQIQTQAGRSIPS